ncbi:hypothetical protein ACP70R_018602 [Stipagrostis hirtigluma subsp. patula]
MKAYNRHALNTLMQWSDIDVCDVLVMADADKITSPDLKTYSNMDQVKLQNFLNPDIICNGKDLFKHATLKVHIQRPLQEDRPIS